MTEILAQLPDGSSAPIITGAISVSMLTWFCWRDGREREERAKDRDERAEERRLFLDKQERIATSVDNLTRATLLEMTNRPQALQRAREEAEQMLAQIGRK
jgi:hypothetical protein